MEYPEEEIQNFHAFNAFLERRETLKSTRMLCDLMNHESQGCSCFQEVPKEKIPEMSHFTILQPDRKFNGDLEMSVAGIFVSSYSPATAPLSPARNRLPPVIKKRKLSDDVVVAPPAGQSTRKPYSYKDKKRGNAQERREIKKKLFMDLGIIRTNSGIDNEEKDRETAMKRKVTETIVTTYCEMCEQNFSSSKMLLLHRSKVHNTTFIECHLCLKLFSQTIHFNRHMKTHYGPNAKSTVQCELCEREFKDKQSLKTHWDVSHGAKESHKLLQ